jgi:UDP-N-acetylmuramoyl-tripeptide--D-alanyl-D-alanine ligase
VTGSSGKTTTKELIGSILTRHASVMVSEGNLNSEIGVPLSAFAVNASHRYAIFEMGINHEGEMGIIAAIVRPNLAVVTNIGTAHIGRLGSQMNIAVEKKKIAAFLKEDEAFFVFEDEPYLDFLGRDISGKMIRYGPRHTQGFEGSRDLGLDGTAIDWEGLRIRFPLLGEHNVRNALAAVAVTGFLGVPAPLIRKGLEEAPPLSGRSRIIRGAVSVIDDCYNANPDSMRSALDFFKTVQWPGEKYAVLGSMLELGGTGVDWHRSLGHEVAVLGLAAVFFFGQEAEEAWKGYREKLSAGNDPVPGGWSADFAELAGLVAGTVREGALVLLKGSRALALERLVPYLQGTPGKGDGA